jgi:protein-disulfide isomerase-like protein with CxxC motif
VTEAVTESVTSAVGTTRTVEFWFDPICPFTWRTSRWLVDVAARRGLTVDWKLMSLGVLNNETVAADEGPLAEAAAALRTLLAAEDTGGQEAVARLYTVLGTRKHDSGQVWTVDAIREAVVDAGLPAEIADAARSPERDARIEASHADSQQRAGMEIGSPILSLDGGRGYFGPVLSDVPAGEDADRLFDGVALLASVPSFSEIKTSR